VATRPPTPPQRTLTCTTVYTTAKQQDLSSRMMMIHNGECPLLKPPVFNGDASHVSKR